MIDTTDILDFALGYVNQDVDLKSQDNGVGNAYDVLFNDRLYNETYNVGTVKIERDALRTRVILEDKSDDPLIRVSFDSESRKAMQREMKRVAVQLAML